MAKFEGFLYYVLQAIGTRSEGPDYHLQLFDYQMIRVIKQSESFQPDPLLHKYVHQKVVIDGKLTEKGIDYQQITKYQVGGGIIPCQGINSKDWQSWNNLMPPGPGHFHVAGEVQVPNPGVEPLLTPKEPQGFNPAILLLDLLLVQKPGLWPEVLVWKPARYDKIKAEYTQVQIFCGSEVIADMQVQIVT